MQSNSTARSLSGRRALSVEPSAPTSRLSMAISIRLEPDAFACDDVD
jgi:hypothetical protein